MHGIADVEEGLRLLQRHEGDRAVIFRHAHLENRRYRIPFHSGRSSEGRRCAARRENRYFSAHKDIQRVGKPRSNDDPARLVEVRKRPVADVARDGFQGVQILGSQAAHDDAGRIGLRRNHHLPFDHRQREFHAGHGVEPVGSRDEIVERAGERPYDHVTVEPKDLVEQLLAEAVHDREHDNQGRDAEHDAQHAEEGDDGYAALLAPGPKVAKGEQPFEWRKRHRFPCRFDCHALIRVLA